MTHISDQIVKRILDRRLVDVLNDGDDGVRHVAILMGLYNGAAHLDAQLESYLAQDHANWSLIVSDDGSRDESVGTVRAFVRATRHPIRLIEGPRRGFARNFLHLLAAAGPHVPFAALSDQDDVWLPGKLARALDKLSAVPNDVPALYAGRTMICDTALKPLRPSFRFDLPPGFRNALVQSIGGGNTMVLNRAALDVVQATARHARNVVAHDWWLYQIISGAGGRVVYDSEPMVLYRQHASNLIGANDSSAASARRLAMVLKGRFRAWNSANVAALRASAHWLTDDARSVLDRFDSLRHGSARKRLHALNDLGLYRQTRRGNMALKFAALTGRI